MIVDLLSSPRNVSTALMYSFAHRSDFQIVDEPFYSYYLCTSGVVHPGQEEIIASQSSDHLEVIRQLESKGEKSPVFVKNMAHHLIEMDLGALTKWTNVFLIRDPKQLIASFAQVIPNPTHGDIGIENQHKIFKLLKEKNEKLAIIDSGELLKNPKSVLSQLCEFLSIPMKENMLKWTPGSIPEDGIWAKYWYENVHKSDGFSKQKTSTRPLPKHCNQLYEEAMPYYEELSKLAIKAN